METNAASAVQSTVEEKVEHKEQRVDVPFM
jgi:hypothetical protein